jgi:hypothetical protein
LDDRVEVVHVLNSARDYAAVFLPDND